VSISGNKQSRISSLVFKAYHHRVLCLDPSSVHEMINSDFHIGFNERLKYQFSESVIRKRPFGSSNHIPRTTLEGIDILSQWL
jgi:hypothetical protein